MTKSANNKNKMYFTIGFIMVIIIVAWILNIKNTFNKNKSDDTDFKKLELEQKWNELTTDLSQGFNNLQKFQQGLGQPSTSSTSQLQAATEIKPDQLKKMLEKIKIEISTTTTSTDLQLTATSTTTQKK